MNKALFLDLDSTIIQTKSGKIFPEDLNDWKFKKGILVKLLEYYKLGYKLIVVTNQAGVESGFFTTREFLDKAQLVLESVCHFINFECTTNKNRVDIQLFPSFYKDSKYRKPRPDRALELAELQDLDLNQSLMVGDASGYVKSYDTKWNFINYGEMPKAAHVVKDFSDSDKKFAENAGIPYLDIERFLQ